MSVPSVAFDRSTAHQTPAQTPIHSEDPSYFTPVAAAGLPLSIVPKVLALTEALAVMLSAMLAKTIYLDFYLNSNPPIYSYTLIAFGMSAILYSTYKRMGLYELDIISSPTINIGKLGAGLVASLLMVLGLLYAVKEIGDLSRGWILIWTALTAISIIIIRLIAISQVRRGKKAGQLLQRTAVIGTTKLALPVASRIQAMEGLSAAVDLYNSGSATDDIRFVGVLSDLEVAMDTRPYDRVVIAVPGTDLEAIRAVVKSLGSYSTELLLCTDLTKMPVVTSGARQLAGIRADIVNVVPLSERSALLKRSFDLFLSTISLALLSPLFILVGLAIKLDSPGPVFFRQRRLGQNNRTFRIFKFRSMHAEEDGPVIVQVTQNDKRVTRVGRFLRATSIDELPQLINVFLGQMSLVGPRPHAVAHDREFDQNFDLFSRRRRVKPGITGWAQINGFRGETKTLEDVRGRMEHDLYYIDNWSIWLDIEIMFRTIFVITRGAY